MRKNRILLLAIGALGLLGLILLAILARQEGWLPTRAANPVAQATVEVGADTPTPTPTMAPTGTPTATPTVNSNATTAAFGAKLGTPTAEPTEIPPTEVETPVPTETPAANDLQAETEGQSTVVLTNDGSTWRVKLNQDGSYGPELGHSRPGVGTSDHEIGIIVGHTLSFITREGEVVYDSGCVQGVLLPNTYAKNSGGADWGFQTWVYNTQVTGWENEMLVLSWEAAQQQVDWEDCPDLPANQLLEHVLVISQDEEYVTVTPWLEFRRASGENRTIMFGPGDAVFGWHLGLGDSQDDCDNGGCYLPSAPSFGWCGGCVINSTWPGEIPADAVPWEALPPTPTPTPKPE